MSSRDSDAEKIMGIELGADDYLVKPFNLELLLTKIRASIRRAYGEYASSVTNHNLGDLPIFYMVSFIDSNYNYVINVEYKI